MLKKVLKQKQRKRGFKSKNILKSQKNLKSKKI